MVMRSHIGHLFFLFLASVPLCIALNSEGQILLALAKGLTIPSPMNSAWNSSDHSPCKWEGIRCDRNGFVVSIELPEREISGSLGKEMGLLRHLRTLDLGINNLSGIIPPELGNCSLLRVLDLSSNLLSGEIPVTLQNLKKLTYLSLFSNSLSGNIPELLLWAPKLAEVYLNDNNLDGSLPSFSGDACSIKFLWFGENNLSGYLPDSIGNCSELEELYLYDNQFTGPLPRISGLRKLRIVDVRSNDLRGTIPLVSNSCRLEQLILANNQFEGQIPEEIGNCSNLTYFKAFNNRLSGVIPSTFGLLSKLEHLFLSMNNLSGVIPSEIGRCQSLTRLELYDNQLEGTIPLEFGNLKHLERLYLFDNNLTGDLPMEILKFPNLTHVLAYNNNLSGELPQEMCELESLRNISLFNNRFRGIIPQCLGINSSLVLIDFTNSGFVGGIPPNICFGNQLSVLALSLNQLNGTVPRGVTNCSSMQRLILKNNGLTGQIPEFSATSSLVHMDLSSNRLNGGIPPSIGNCVNLNLINWSGNELEGPLPPEIETLGKLQSLNMSNNNLYGSLPPQISKCGRLYLLDLGFNSLNGTIPTSLAKLERLSQLILQGNRFSGGIPDSLSKFSGLIDLQLGGNKLGGSIPSSLGSLQNLDTALDLSDNGLEGQLPIQLGDLKLLQRLDISLNNLTGSLLPLSGLISLLYINVSYNNFSGPLPQNWLKFVQQSPSSFMGNPELCISCQAGDSTCTGVVGLKQCAAPSNNSKGSRKMVIVLVTLGSLLPFALIILLGGSLHMILKRRSKDEDASLHEGSSILLKQLIEATENLDDKYEIGRGAHGTVYKAVLDTGKIYGLKKLSSDVRLGSKTSMVTEIQTIGKIRHRNLLKLENFWMKRDCGLILYEYMENGSLHDILHELNSAPVLEWRTRCNIALGTAHGLAYLHNDCSPAIIHRDIKPKNILMDANMEPHISDFGIAKLLGGDSTSSQSTAVIGTHGYISPETAFTARKNKESDVYSYGVVLLELVTRKRALDPSFPENMHIVGWVTSTLEGTGEIESVVDQNLLNEVMGTSEMEEVNKFLSLAIRCTLTEPSRRPSMQDVVRELTDLKPRFGGSQKHNRFDEPINLRDNFNDV